MANIYNDEFKDAIDELNKMAYMIVDGNAKEWARKATKINLITYQDQAKIVQLIDLRNSMGHGNSRYINVGPSEVSEVKKYATIMSKNANKLNGHKNSKSSPNATNHQSHDKPKKASNYYPDTFFEDYNQRSINRVKEEKTSYIPFTRSRLLGIIRCKSCHRMESFYLEYVDDYDGLICCRYCGHDAWVPLKYLPSSIKKTHF